MNRITPQKSEIIREVPDWLNVQELVDVGKPELNIQQRGFTKQASNDLEVLSYACSNCKKVFYKGHRELEAQKNMQKRAGKRVFDYSCPNCSSSLHPYKEVAKIDTVISNTYASQTEHNKDISKESSTYNTYVDRHLVFKAINALETFAHKQGMWGARARYINSEHTKQAGQSYPILNSFNCELEWAYGRDQKCRVTANISIDQAGKFKFPHIFKDASGNEYSFEKDSIKSLEKEVDMGSRETPSKKSDTPIFRKQDVSRFKSASQKLGSNEDVTGETYSSLGKKSNTTPLVPRDPAQFQPGQTVESLGKPYRIENVTPGQGVSLVDPTTGKKTVMDQDNAKYLQPSTGVTTSSYDLIRESRQSRAMRELGLTQISTEVEKDETGHDKYHGIPYSPDEDTTLGTDEFPVDEKKEDSSGHPNDPSKQKGYRIPFKEMDENQVKQREEFPNQDLLHMKSVPVRDLDIYKKKSVSDLEKEAVMQVLGFNNEDDDVEEYEQDVAYKDYKKSPPGFPEPPTIEKAKGGVSEMITKYKYHQDIITKLQTKIKDLQAPFIAELGEINKRMNETLSPTTSELKAQQEILNKYFSRLWKRLDDVKDKIVWYEDKIIGNWEKSEFKATPASLAEIIRKAQEVEPALVESIEKIKALIENERTTSLITKTLIEYPISKSQQPKLKSSSSVVDFMTWFDDATDVLNELEDVLLSM